MSCVVPYNVPNCTIDRVRTINTTLIIEAHAHPPAPCCPTCGTRSIRIHSRYQRVVHDLPMAEQAVRLRLQVRRFFCDKPTCPRRTFAEPLPDLVPAHAQRTVRLTRTLETIGFALGGAAGARLAHQLHMRVSGTTLLRIIRTTPMRQHPPPTVLGVDDFALCKGRTYGTILLDLERRCPIDLLPDRTAATLATWLRDHPTVQMITRDRALDYARGATDGAPQAIQVADRFHLLCNVRQAVERALLRLTPTLRRQIALSATEAVVSIPSLEAAPPPPRYAPHPSLQRLQALRRTERAQRYQAVQERAAQGQTQRQIAQACGLSTITVRRWLQTDTLPPERRGYRATGKIDPSVPYVHTRLAAGCTNQSRLWREIREQGFTGTRSLVGKWIRGQSGRHPTPATAPAVALPSAAQIAWHICAPNDQPSRIDAGLWQQLLQHAEVQSLWEMTQPFLAMVRQRQPAQFSPWLTNCLTSTIPELRNFARGLQRDAAAVMAALAVPWSNGPVEGHIHRVKLIKRSMYGRANFDLLRQRVLYVK